MIIKDRIDFLARASAAYLPVDDVIEKCVIDMQGGAWLIDNDCEYYTKEIFDKQDPNSTSMLMGQDNVVNEIQRKFIAKKYGKDSKEYMNVDESVKNSKVHLEAHREGSPEAIKAEFEVHGGAVHLGTGVGTELKKLLSYIGINSTPNCSCNQRAKVMNNNGIQWCKDNKEKILDWLKEESTKRGLPFLKFPAKRILNYAISRAEKVEKQHVLQ